MSDNTKNTSKSMSVGLTELNVKNYNLLKTCRLCLNEINELVSLFDKNSANQQELLYSEMVVECASVKVDRNDELPKVICLECVERLNNSYEFRKLCKNSERTLHEFLEKFKTEAESDEEIKPEFLIHIEDNFLIPKKEPTSPKSDNFLIETENNFDENINDIQPELINEPNELIFSSNSNEQINKTEQSVEYNCNICNSNFPSSQFLNKHLKEMHKTKASYNCTECSRTFKRFGNLKKHSCAQDTNKRFACEICGKILSNNYFLKAHLKDHSGQKDYNCDVCGKGFNVMSNLKHHQRIHSRNPDEKPYKCKDCGKSYPALQYLKIHEKNHSGKKPYSCKKCGKAFYYSSHLKRHEQRHTGERTYLCKVCGVGFYRHNDLQRHERTHSGEKPFKCNECGKCFGDLTYLNIHQTVHLGGKAYSCKECNKQFAFRSTLYSHVKKFHQTVKKINSVILG